MQIVNGIPSSRDGEWAHPLRTPRQLRRNLGCPHCNKRYPVAGQILRYLSVFPERDRGSLHSWDTLCRDRRDTYETTRHK